MFHHILVAVDGSPEADLALAHAIELAYGQNARLTALTTVARPPWLSAWGLAQAGGAGWLKDAYEVAENVSRSARERVPSHISVTGVVTRHSLRKGLVEQIRRGQHDLVVIASHRHGLRSCVRALGRIDVTHHIAKHGQVAVLTVSPEPLARPRLVRSEEIARAGTADLNRTAEELTFDLSPTIQTGAHHRR